MLAAGGDPTREVLRLIPTRDGTFYTTDADGCVWRMYYFIIGAKTFQTAETPELFYNSALAFGKFQRMLSDFPADKLHETIPNFHNTVSRFADFKKALADDVAGRADSVREEVQFVLDHEGICSYITDRIASGEYPLRVTHNDTKLNNILIDKATGKPICIIDLDTVMPGSVLFDFGDATAKDIMVPKVDMSFLDVNASYGQTMEVYRDKCVKALAIADYDWDELGAVIGTHAGPGCYGLAYIGLK